MPEGELAGVAAQDVPALAEVGPEDNQDQDVDRVVVGRQAEQRQRDEDRRPDGERAAGTDRPPTPAPSDPPPRRRYRGRHRLGAHWRAPSRPVGFNGEHQDEDREDDQVLQQGGRQQRPEVLGDPDHEPAQQRPGQVAHPAQDDRDEGDQDEDLADIRRDPEERQHHRPGQRDAGDPDPEGDAVDRPDVDPDQLGAVALLGRRPHRLADVGALEQQEQGPADGQRGQAGEQARHADEQVDRAEGNVQVQAL